MGEAEKRSSENSLKISETQNVNADAAEELTLVINIEMRVVRGGFFLEAVKQSSVSESFLT